MISIKKIIGILFIVTVVIISVGFIYLSNSYPRVDKAKNINIKPTPERLKRGAYLVNNVAGCINCHSDRDWTKYSAPVIPGTEGKGGFAFDKQNEGIPGVVYAKNITPAGIGGWTDGELLRVITTGVTRSGTALYPLMPYLHYRNLSEEDIYSIIVYIRTLKPIQNSVAKRHLKFPMNIIVKTFPLNAPEKYPVMPLKSDSVAYGEYMANCAACVYCHSRQINGHAVQEKEFAGGFRFCFPDGVCVTSANITPDTETGIGLLSRDAFIDKFRFYRQEASGKIPVKDGENKTVMPWTGLSGMTDEDLGAIYTFLRTLKPVNNKIEKFSRN